jgi:hypothetical protein
MFAKSIHHPRLKGQKVFHNLLQPYKEWSGALSMGSSLPESNLPVSIAAGLSGAYRQIRELQVLRLRRSRARRRLPAMFSLPARNCT